MILWNVPGARSPPCMGITVRLPFNQTFKWDPFPCSSRIGQPRLVASRLRRPSKSLAVIKGRLTAAEPSHKRLNVIRLLVVAFATHIWLRCQFPEKSKLSRAPSASPTTGSGVPRLAQCC